MALRKLRPITAGTRHRLSPGFEDITETKPEKSLVVTIKKTGGRNNSGRICTGLGRTQALDRVGLDCWYCFCRAHCSS